MREMKWRQVHALDDLIAGPPARSVFEALPIWLAEREAELRIRPISIGVQHVVLDPDPAGAVQPAALHPDPGGVHCTISCRLYVMGTFADSMERAIRAACLAIDVRILEDFGTPSTQTTEQLERGTLAEQLDQIEDLVSSDDEPEGNK